MRRDCRVLESFKIMDYSLLLGIHNLDRAAREREEEEKSANSNLEKQRSFQQKAKLVAHSTAMESIQATSDPVDIPHELQGGMPARNHKGERILIFVGIIDILQSYRLSKKLEHTFKAIIHDGVSSCCTLECVVNWSLIHNLKFVNINISSFSGHCFCAQTRFLRQTLHELHVDKNIQEDPIM